VNATSVYTITIDGSPHIFSLAHRRIFLGLLKMCWSVVDEIEIWFLLGDFYISVAGR
jgi:hypothetical protein